MTQAGDTAKQRRDWTSRRGWFHLQPNSDPFLYKDQTPSKVFPGTGNFIPLLHKSDY